MKTNANSSRVTRHSSLRRLIRTVLPIILFATTALLPTAAQAQYSVAREWNEALLNAIRNDYARPTVHARNLFHTSVALYDAWAAFSDSDDTYFLGKSVHDYPCPFAGMPAPANVKAAQEEAMSYAAYRLMIHRFQHSPGIAPTYYYLNQLMDELGYPKEFTDTNYTTGSPAALGNYLAQQLIRYGLQDGSNEADEYANQYYQPQNDPLIPAEPGNPGITNPNAWQPLTFDVFIDQSGNPIPINTPPFLGPEWGNVQPFSLLEEDLTVYTRNGDQYKVYHDPDMPPHLDDPQTAEFYMWNFALVAIWASHNDTSDGVFWDISPGAMGNITDLPETWQEIRDFYDLYEGGDPGQGHAVNPATGQPYAPQVIPRGDYTRILAEFWADGPDSETPPGHWFTILNYVNDHPALVKQFQGTGPVRDDLEWDVKSYFLLGGAMHDVAITAWGIKGWYDYIRPISAIRHLADNGQCTDNSLPNYSPMGIPLHPGLIEVVEAGDPLAGDMGQHIGKIKLYTWRGPDYIDDPETDMAGVGWILAENWWPYQRPTFVTPPFAGYISGHSTFSRAAAEVLTMLTGDPFFPGGMGEFDAPKNEFLVFEEGPSRDVTLQWATYRDASDQCSLSRIWGGIHPPVDDIPGRHIGKAIALEAFDKALQYFDREGLPVVETEIISLQVFPNPARADHNFRITMPEGYTPGTLQVYHSGGALVYEAGTRGGQTAVIPAGTLNGGMHFIRLEDGAGKVYRASVAVY